jgi:hypothetical protein
MVPLGERVGLVPAVVDAAVVSVERGELAGNVHGLEQDARVGERHCARETLP